MYVHYVSFHTYPWGDAANNFRTFDGACFFALVLGLQIPKEYNHQFNDPERIGVVALYPMNCSKHTYVGNAPNFLLHTTCPINALRTLASQLLIALQGVYINQLGS